MGEQKNKSNAGRKKKYNKTFPELAGQYASEGMTDVEMCKKLCISHDSFYKYKKEYPEFAEAIDKGKKEINHKVEQALLKRALGFDYEETTTEYASGKDGKPKIKSQRKVKKTVLPEVRAMEMWLYNRDPERWKRASSVDLTTGGDPLKNEPPKVIIFNGTDNE
jgi:hypothetical protein